MWGVVSRVSVGLDLVAAAIGTGLAISGAWAHDTLTTLAGTCMTLVWTAAAVMAVGDVVRRRTARSYAAASELYADLIGPLHHDPGVIVEARFWCEETDADDKVHMHVKTISIPPDKETER